MHFFHLQQLIINSQRSVTDSKQGHSIGMQGIEWIFSLEIIWRNLKNNPLCPGETARLESALHE